MKMRLEPKRIKVVAIPVVEGKEMGNLACSIDIFDTTPNDFLQWVRSGIVGGKVDGKISDETIKSNILNYLGNKHSLGKTAVSLDDICEEVDNGIIRNGWKQRKMEGILMGMIKEKTCGSVPGKKEYFKVEE